MLQKLLRLANLQLFARGRMIVARVFKCNDGQSANDGEIKRHMGIRHMAISSSHIDSHVEPSSCFNWNFQIHEFINMNSHYDLLGNYFSCPN